MNEYWLSEGAHASPVEGRCAMEWVAYIAGEPHTDTPRCVDAALADFAIGINDNCDDEDRQKLRPYLARMIGTADDGRDYGAPIREWIHARTVATNCGCDRCLFREGAFPRVLGLLDEILPKEFIDLPDPVAARAREVCSL